jgi:HPt (histidine-containing phosphotransfer) domain-containing protein
MPAPLPLSPDFNPAALAEVKTLMGAKFARMLEFYIEDALENIAVITTAAQSHDFGALIPPAHTLKSASQQFGLEAVAALARQLEETARLSVEQNAPLSPATVQDLATRLHTAFAAGAEILRRAG